MDIKTQVIVVNAKTGREIGGSSLNEVPGEKPPAKEVSESKVSLSVSPEKLKNIVNEAGAQDIGSDAKIAEIKEAIASGSYRVDSGKIAAAMMNEAMW
jgi:negative regulator of flagellin synthesis FlgM